MNTVYEYDTVKKMYKCSQHLPCAQQTNFKQMTNKQKQSNNSFMNETVYLLKHYTLTSLPIPQPFWLTFYLE